MIDRAAFWYIFGLAAIFIIILRLQAIRKANWRDPVMVSFTSGVFFCTFGVLAKQPVLAGIVDRLLGLNAAWVLADSLFLLGLCGLTYWIDLMRRPALKKAGFALLGYKRFLVLVAVIGWMAGTAAWQMPIWRALERGGINVAGQPLLLSSRLAYFSYSLWGLAYLSRRFHQLRKQMRDRISYIRLSLAWAAVTLATVAPILQIIATLTIFFRPALLATLWPPVWQMVSTIQFIVAALVLTLFFEPAYRTVSWLDKQILVYRLLQARQTIAHLRPDLIANPIELKRGRLFVEDSDRWLATLVNELEIARSLMGTTTDHLVVPAGGTMSEAVRDELKRQQVQFQQALKTKEPLNSLLITGDTYTLARWYAHFSVV